MKPQFERMSGYAIVTLLEEKLIKKIPDSLRENFK